MTRIKIAFKTFLLFFIFSIYLNLFAQSKKENIFWQENFSSGKLPSGWYIPTVGNWDPQWIVTDQPYPGSYKYQQQAPPIASDSRGYFLQFQAGYFTDEDVDSWAKKKQYPDGFVVSAPINCLGKKSVILKFQQKFRWWDYKMNDSSGLFVGVSTDSTHWHEWDVRHEIKSGTDMFAPLQEEINISKWAANQPTVFLRFYWKGMMGFYWMLDNIKLCEGFQQDVSIVRLLSHNEENNQFKKQDQFILQIKNAGEKTINKDFEIKCNLDGKSMVSAKVNAYSDPLLPDQTRDIVFDKIDLTKSPVHKVSFEIIYPQDQNQSNNSFSKVLNAASSNLGKIDSVSKGKNSFVFSSGISKVKIQFYKEDIFRIALAPDGKFKDPLEDGIIVAKPLDNLKIACKDKGEYILLQSKKCALRVYKSPIHFAMYDEANLDAIWKELKPIEFGEKTIQTISSKPNEYYYGCGMQNGYFSHKGKNILIEKGNGWDDGGRPNPAPFYMSTGGYGVLRNTFDAGEYDFGDTLKLSHNENRLDAFYFYGPSLKQILNDYTYISGRPFLMPRWAMSMGDANCYNKPGRDKKAQTTPDVIWKVADKYIENNMPRGWILPNDGYGCGYVKLDSVVKELHKRGFYTGLWTENGLDKIATEVGKYGTRLCKLDVAWVGPGYKFALDACRAAYQGIENNSNARGFVWSVMGWAGTQRYSTVWSGDQYGGWEYIRFHIPTIIGAGLSAQNAASSDVDGIFGGSDSSYTRDLQWKCFTPVFMAMSGWAKKDKQPYISGEPFTSINRKYLQLKMRLTPYMYSLCHEANKTGVPATRAMVLEFPDDSVTWSKLTQYQFMNGPDFLVAPVYKSEGERDSIYLPKGNWIDYWSNEKIAGGRWLRHYDAALDKLPLFVKEGAIIPMYPQMDYDGEKRADTLTLDIYPNGKSFFDLYEDDGLTREHRKGAYATTLFEVNGGKNISITINPVKGNYSGKYLKRNYFLQVHQNQMPSKIKMSEKYFTQYHSLDDLEKNGNGYFFDKNKKVLYLLTSKLETENKSSILIEYQ